MGYVYNYVILGAVHNYVTQLGEAGRSTWTTTWLKLKVNGSVGVPVEKEG